MIKKIFFFIVLFQFSCENDPLMNGIFPSVFAEGYNLQFLEKSNKAILFLPNEIVCNEYNVEQLELDVKRVDNNAIQLSYSNKDFNYSDLNDWAFFCLKYTPILKRIKWEESNGLRNGYVNRNIVVDRISLNPLDIENLYPNNVYVINELIIYKLWRVAYYNGYKKNMLDFYQLINKNKEALSDIYQIAITEKGLLEKHEYDLDLMDESEYKKYENLSFEEFKSLLDIGYVSLVNEDYLKIVKHVNQIHFITSKLLNKILIINNLDDETTIGEGDKVYFKLVKDD